MSHRKRCKNCGRLYRQNPRIKNQKYCGREECQRARKAAWQREKMSVDPMYRENQKRAQETWRNDHPDCWKKYREKNQKCREKNREKQKERDVKRKQKREKMDTSSPNLAKMDTFEGKNQIKPGRYYIISVESDLAKIDPLKSEIYIISDGCNHLAKKDSMDIQNFSP